MTISFERAPKKIKEPRVDVDTLIEYAEHALKAARESGAESWNVLCPRAITSPTDSRVITAIQRLAAEKQISATAKTETDKGAPNNPFSGWLGQAILALDEQIPMVILFGTVRR